MIRRTTPWLLGFLLAAAPQVASAGTLPSSFGLGKFVPGDWWMYMHFVHNPERQWVEDRWAEVWDALVKTGLDQDILSLVSSVAGEDGGAGFGAAVDAAKDLIGSVPWSDLVKHEFVFAEKISLPMPEYIFLTRGTEGSGAASAKGLVAILNKLASMSDEVNVVPSDDRGVKSWALTSKGDAPYALHLFQKGDVIGMLIGQASLDPIVASLAAGGSTSAIVDQPRFKEALKQVAVPEDGVMYFDYRMLLTGIKSLMDEGFKKACEGEEEGSELKPDAMVKVVAKAVQMIDIFDYGIASLETKGHQQFTYAATKLQEGKSDEPIAKLFLDRKPFEPFDRFIPADAVGFSVDGFVDLGLLYHTLLDFVADEIPDGQVYLEQWKGIQAGFGFDVDRDLFSWWSGEMVTIDLPAAMAGPFGGSDSVVMIRVKDSALAAEKIDSALTWLTAKATDMKQPLLLSPLPNGPEGFKQITLQPLAMFLRPVVGVKDDWLIFSTSPGALEKCLAVASGKAPSIMKNERFRSEGLVPKGAVRSASFKDTSKFGQDLSKGLGMASFVGTMMGAGMAGQADADPAAKDKHRLMQKVFGMLMKLGPVVQKIDFYSSESSISTREGLFCHNTKVTTYKKQESKTAESSLRK